jgi:hypothetical protein
MRFTKTLPLAVAALLVLPGAALAKDRNHDGLPDGWEKAHHLSLKVKQGTRDQDNDGLRNRGEFRAGTNPRSADSDNDGIKDGEENAGKVTSFTNGVLTISLFDGSTLTGTVDNGTKVKCEGAGDDQGDDRGGDRARAASHGNDDGRGENRGSDNENNGDNGDDDGPNDNADEHATGCTIAAGDVVREADVKATSSGKVFEEVELAK